MKSGRHRSSDSIAAKNRDDDKSQLKRAATIRNSSQNVVTPQDYEELKKHYQFVLPKKKDQSSTSWQERMVENYHSHLYKEFAIVDLSVPGRIGLRFRTKEEVVSGKGVETCGNKHCPSFLNPKIHSQVARDRHLATAGRQQDEDKSSAPGEGLCDYEVPFQYVENNETKMELVKLRLCRSCAPLLMERSPNAKKKEGVEIGKARHDKGKDHSNSSESSSSSRSDELSSESSSRRRKRKRHRKRKKRNRQDDEPEGATNSDESSSESSGRKKRKRYRKSKPANRQEGATTDESRSKISGGTNDDSSRAFDRQHRRDRRKESRKRKKHKKHKRSKK